MDSTINGIVHLAGIGDVTYLNSNFAGTRGEERRLEGFTMRISPPIEGLGLRYKAHLQGTGDTPFVNEGAFVGTRNQFRRLEGFAVELTGPAAARWDIIYRAHLEGIGDTREVQNGEFIGTMNQARRLEGLQARLARRELFSEDLTAEQQALIEQIRASTQQVTADLDRMIRDDLGGRSSEMAAAMADPVGFAATHGVPVGMLVPSEQRQYAAGIRALEQDMRAKIQTSGDSQARSASSAVGCGFCQGALLFLFLLVGAVLSTGVAAAVGALLGLSLAATKIIFDLIAAIAVPSALALPALVCREAGACA